MQDAEAVTLVDVARRAGVSLATASRVMNGSTRKVSVALRERVLDAAREMRYVRNANAQALAKARSAIVGVIVHDIGDPYFSEILRGIESCADERGGLLLVCDTHRDPGREVEYLTLLHAHRASTIVLAGSGRDDGVHNEAVGSRLEAFAGGGGRVVVIGRHPYPADAVLPDNTGGARALMWEILARGHREIAIISGPPLLTTTRDRLAGLRLAFEDAGVPFSRATLLEGTFGRESGVAAVHAIYAAGEEPTAIVALNDEMAVGALGALRALGKRVPDDVSLAGFDDIPVASDVTPCLTTVRVPLNRIGEIAMRLALEPLATQPRAVHVPTETMLRASLGPPSGNAR
jgi:LacI family transcriptional regulator